MTRPSRTGGKTSAAKARNAGPAKGRKTTKPKPRIATAATRVKRRSISDPSKDLKEAREQQAATAEILKVIASSPDDVQPVFEAIAASAKRLIGGFSAAVFRFVADVGYLAAFTPIHPDTDEVWKVSFPRRLSDFLPFEWVRDGEPAQVTDTETEPAVRDLGRLRGGYRSLLVAPLMSNGAPIGLVSVTRREPGTFAAHHVQLLQTFADQAVIAIENVRLFNETQQSLARQAATTEILEVVNSSPGNLTPVFDAILEKATLLSNSAFGALAIHNGDDMHQIVAMRGMPAELPDFLRGPVRLGPETGLGRLVRGESFVHIIDAADDEGYRLGNPVRRALVDIAGARSYLAVPIAKDGILLGSFTIYRREVRPFEADLIALLQNFATQAAIAIENARLFNETREALERQTATADILKVIASSRSDLQPVFDAIAHSAKRLIGGFSTAVHRVIDDIDHLVAFTPTNPESDEVLKAAFPRLRSEMPAIISLVENGETAQIADSETADGQIRKLARARGWRSATYTPLMYQGTFIGFIVCTRRETGILADHHVQLLRTFADQAVIAIENVRLFDEVNARTEDLRESLQQQTATADVLKVISRSAFDLQPVLDTIVETASRLCAAEYAFIYKLQDDGKYHMAANHGADQLFLKYAVEHPLTPGRGSLVGRTALERKTVHMPDCLADPEYVALEYQSVGHYRSNLGVPLLREGVPIGVIILMRAVVMPFTDRQIDLVTTFADQAVIAIENVSLFDEVQAKTRDLTESLQQQTATADVLKVISRSAFDLNSVMDTLTSSAAELCKAEVSALYLREGDVLVARGVAHADATQVDFLRRTPLQIDDSTYIGRTFQAAAVRNIGDVATETETGQLKRFSEVLGFRSIVFVPLMRELSSVGIFALARARTGLFSEREVELVQTFADQAVIAVENVRLFEEVRQRTRELSESLEQQVATSEVLQVISSSPGELEPVFQSMLANATRLCEAECGVMWLREGDDFRSAAIHGPLPPAYVEQWRGGTPVHPNPHGPLTILAQTRKTVHVPDMREDRSYLDRHPLPVAAVDVAGIRTLLLVPMSKEDELVGGIAVYRQEVRPFTDKQIALVQNFAAQAVIAIENARLLNELRQRTGDLAESLQQQTATADVLQVISESPGNLEPVFEKMLVNATRVCSAEFGSMNLSENGAMRPVAQYNVPAEYAAARGDRVFVPHPKSPLAKAIRTKQVVHWADLRTTEGYLERYRPAIELVELGGARTVAIVPMLRDDEVIGAITIYRKEVQLFSDKQIELLSNFAKQAVIAIENARLLKELRQRTDDLSKSLDDLRTAQDRLVQTEKLASLGQLTAGIAHEIKNPLNFVNNFSALSAELTDELNDVLKPATLDSKVRGEVDELTGLLKDNLEKVVQHGKRADSIVKNMLLHSREGSREHRPADINSLLDESLNLAYHGARAEKGEFNITLERDFDENAGTIELFPQEITRAFLNLIANGVYAATKRKTEDKGSGFEPTLRATTKNLGTIVEIRIRDNGTGIPAEVQQKMFNPFFTTKPAGEGTGLGLSMTHDIIVKQHGGRIDVETEPGQFTEFTIVLPRKSNVSGRDRGET